MEELDLLKKRLGRKLPLNKYQIRLYKMIHKIIFDCEVDFNHSILEVLVLEYNGLVFNNDDYLEKISKSGFRHFISK
jgi:hypothetical protein